MCEFIPGSKLSTTTKVSTRSLGMCQLVIHTRMLNFVLIEQ
jgi:hypothetical protein